MKRMVLGIGIIGILIISIFAGYYLPTLMTETSHGEEIVEQVEETASPHVKADEIQDSNVPDHAEQWLKENLQTIIKPLGFLVIISDPSSGLQDYCVEKGNDILETVQSRQLFIMEDILQDSYNFKLFTTLVDNQMETYEAPTDEMVLVYLPYDVFNKQYETLFNEPFDIAHSITSEALPDNIANAYVYYDNRRAGNNGVGVDSFEVEQINAAASSETYEAVLVLHYSERAAERLGRSFDNATLKYQVIGEQLVLKGLYIDND